jgi:hypothetical protein
MSKTESTSPRGQQLVNQLLANPIIFESEGKSYSLLQEFFHGFSIDSLRTLLTHDNPIVKRVGIWISSELGLSASSLLDYTIPFLKDADRYMRYHALEIVMVCSIGKNLEKIVHVIAALEDDDQVIRVHTMFLLKNASAAQLAAAFKDWSSLGPNAEFHRTGILALLAGEAVDPNEIALMIDHGEPLVRRYGAIGAERIWKKYPECIVGAVNNEDADVRTFAIKMQELRQSIESK